MEEKRRNVYEKKNPGLMVKLNERCRGTYPGLFDGLHVNVNRDLSKHFKVNHSTYLSSITPGNYRFGATYAGSKQAGPDTSFPVLAGDIDSEGNLNASITHLLGSRLRMKFDGQMFKENFQRTELANHYMGDDFTASLLVLNPNFMEKSGGILLQYLQNVTSRLAIGTEFAYMHKMTPFKQPGLLKPNSPFSHVAVCARYNTDNSCLSSFFSLHSFLLSYFSKASEQLSFGMEINTNFRTNLSVASLAYKVELKDRGIVCKGMIDTDGNVGSVFERSIKDTPFKFSVSTNFNHKANNFRLGCGFTVK